MGGAGEGEEGVTRVVRAGRNCKGEEASGGEEVCGVGQGGGRGVSGGGEVVDGRVEGEEGRHGKGEEAYGEGGTGEGEEAGGAGKGEGGRLCDVARASGAWRFLPL